MFDGMQVRDFLESQKREIKSAIEQASDDEILDRDEDEYVDELLQDYTFECPVINFEEVRVSDSEKLIPSEQFPPDFVTRPGKSYPVNVITFYLPFTGDDELFHCTPSQYSLWFPEVFIEDRYVCFEIVNFKKDMEIVKREADRIIDSIRTFSEALTRDFDMHAIKRGDIEEMIRARKQRLLNNKDLLATLGVPIIKSENFPRLNSVNNMKHKEEKILASTPKSIKAIEIFYSYSHRDEKLRNKLDKHLISLKRQGLITSWHDRDISAGTEWKHEIGTHLSTAQIILLLVSPDFIGSDYCYSIEMKRALERNDAKEARVIPIILRPTDWKDTPLGKLQALPTDGRPITSRSWGNQDEAFFDVEMGIKKVVKELTGFNEPIINSEKPRIDQKTKYKAMKAHILFVDDEIDEKMKALRAFLTNKGYSTELVINGREALVQMQKRQPDIIVLDLAMPVMEGFEVIRRIRMEGNNVPIIIMTAHPDSNYIDEAYEIGANAYITKYIKPSDLLVRIEALLKDR